MMRLSLLRGDEVVTAQWCRWWSYKGCCHNWLLERTKGCHHKKSMVTLTIVTRKVRLSLSLKEEYYLRKGYNTTTVYHRREEDHTSPLSMIKLYHIDVIFVYASLFGFWFNPNSTRFDSFWKIRLESRPRSD